MVLFRLFVFLITFSLFSCSSGRNADQQKGFLRIKDQAFVDSEGRQVILSGINFISKDSSQKYMPSDGEEIFKQFADWGFNCIRFGIIWDGLEPVPGQYNEDYLKEIDKRIEWAAQNGLYVYLDMHQDLYSVRFADGAPAWATLDEGKEHVAGSVWSDAYLMSPAVQTAFDNFWNNAPAPDGVGLQDHYANLWKHIAKRYANNPTVIGYDIMNEPFMGSDANQVMPLILGAYAQILAEETGQAPPSPQELEAMWADEASRLKAYELIATSDKYSRVVDAVYEVSANFEINRLMPMYQKVANAIREVDRNHILFFNHNYFVNMGVPSAIETTCLPDGSRDSLVAYSAHGYDLVVDTKEVENPSYERVEFIFNRIAEGGKRMGMPVLLGEWGALHSHSPQMVKTAQHLVRQIEKHNFSNSYWAYYKGIGDYPYFQKAIVRPYPQAVSGSLISYHFEINTGQFTMSWHEDAAIQAPTVIYLPWLDSISDVVAIDPESEKLETEQIKGTKAGRLIIPPTGKGGIRTVGFQMVWQENASYQIPKN